MAETNETGEAAEAREGAESKGFSRHPFLSYQGYAFPWYATLIWISFFAGGLIYLVRYIVFE